MQKSESLDKLAAALVKVQAELRPSKAELERQTQATCRSIAYPHGRYTQEVAAMAREAGYCVAVTTVEGPASASASLMALPRIGLPSYPLTDRDLLARATGLSVALSKTQKLFSLTGRRNSESISGRHRRVHRVLQ